MALQSSGAISLANLQSEYGGSNPISMSEYYRNGGLVPNSISSTGPGSYTSYQYSRNSTDWNVYIFGTINWSGSNIVSSSLSIGTTTTSFSTGGYDYQRGSLQETITISGKITTITNHYSVRRRLSSVTTTTSINQSVPTSGAISLSNFYGGRAS